MHTHLRSASVSRASLQARTGRLELSLWRRDAARARRRAGRLGLTPARPTRRAQNIDRRRTPRLLPLPLLVLLASHRDAHGAQAAVERVATCALEAVDLGALHVLRLRSDVLTAPQLVQQIEAVLVSCEPTADGNIMPVHTQLILWHFPLDGYFVHIN